MKTRQNHIFAAAGLSMLMMVAPASAQNDAGPSPGSGEDMARALDREAPSNIRLDQTGVRGDRINQTLGRMSGPRISDQAYGEEKPVNPGVGGSGPANLPQPIIHLTFDGSLENRGSFPAPPNLIVGKGELSEAGANYAEGKIGQAIKLTGDYAVQIPFDLNREAYPQTTVTAWVWSEPGRKQGQVPIIANGGMVLLNLYANAVHLRGGPGRDASARETGQAVPNGRWVFVAGVYDSETESIRLHVDTRQQNAVLKLDRLQPDQRSVWIGAKADIVRQGGGDIRVDDVRIYDTALSPDQVMGLYKQGLQAVRKKPGRTKAEMPDATREMASTTPAPGTPGFGEEGALGGWHLDKGDGEDGSMAGSGADSDGGSEQSTTTMSEPLLETPTTITNPTGITGPVGGPAQEVEEDVETAQEAAATSTAPVIYTPQVQKEAEAVIFPQGGEDAEDSGNPAEPTSDPDPVPAGWIISETDMTYSPISGQNGEVSESSNRVQYMTEGSADVQWFDWIKIYERNNVPCKVGYFSFPLDEGDTNFMTARCNGRSGGDEISVRVDDAYIVGVQVCTNNLANARVKGLRISGYKIDPTTGQFTQAVSDGYQLPNCASWKDAVRCSPGYVATGGVSHYNLRTRDRSDELVGLQLICHKIVPQFE